MQGKACDVQLQEGEVGVAVVRLALALLHDIVLEGARRLGVVAVEAIEDLLDVIRPFWREVEGGAHFGLLVMRSLCERRVKFEVRERTSQAATARVSPENYWRPLQRLHIASIHDNHAALRQRIRG